MKKFPLLAFFIAINLSFAYPLHAESIWRKTFNLFGKSNNQQQPPTIKPKVGIIEITDSPDLKKTCHNLISVAKNDEISGIILIIDNYGGAIEVYSVLHDLIKKITLTKPVVALVISALSGGYWIASTTNYIIAHSASSVGHIGACFEVRRDKEVKQKGDIEAQMDIEIFKAGKFKTIFHRYENDLSDEERTFIQERLEKYYLLFKSTVANNRNLLLEDSEKWAEGKVFFEIEALEMGLIDEIGTYFDAENKIIELISQRNPDTKYDTNIEPVYL